MARKVARLDRRRAKRTAKAKYYLLCEGANTEPDYFNCLKNVACSNLLEIEIVGGGGVPLTLADKAVDKAVSLGLTRRKGAKKPRESFEESDKVWAVFDRDEHPNFDEAIRRCDGAGVGAAWSDPCFELWLLLHIKEYDRACTHHEAQDDLQKLLEGYSRGRGKTCDFSEILKNIKIAEGRAERQLNRRSEEGAEKNPSTNVYKLTRELRKK
ncbi:RloB family protein [Thalassospira lucentensis]|uniref:RloB family protein n=1 Tax=Thalassospira lucentensis TaxID=168935 RepID=UPI003D2F09D4